MLDNSLCLVGFKEDNVEGMSKIMSAPKQLVPAISAWGHGRLPQINRLLTSLRRLAPSFQRLPLQLVALCAMMVIAVARGKLDDAIRLFVQFRTYLRPGECDLLTGSYLMLPQPRGCPQYQLLPLLFYKDNDFRPSKTVMTDEATLIDTDSLLLHFLEAVEKRRALLIPRLLSEMDDTLSLFKLPAMYIGLDALKLSQCALKHV